MLAQVCQMTEPMPTSILGKKNQHGLFNQRSDLIKNNFFEKKEWWQTIRWEISEK